MDEAIREMTVATTCADECSPGLTMDGQHNHILLCDHLVKPIVTTLSEVGHVNI